MPTLIEMITTMTVMAGIPSEIIEIVETRVDTKTKTTMIEMTITVIEIKDLTIDQKISMATLPTICTIIKLTMIIIINVMILGIRKIIMAIVTILIIGEDMATIKLMIITGMACQIQIYRRVSMTISFAKRMRQLIGTGPVALGFPQLFVAYWLGWENTCKRTTLTI